MDFAGHDRDCGVWHGDLQFGLVDGRRIVVLFLLSLMLMLTEGVLGATTQRLILLFLLVLCLVSHLPRHSLDAGR